MTSEPARRVLDDELQAAAAAQQELGGGYDGAVVRSLAERLDGELDARIDHRLSRHRSAAAPELVTIVLALSSIGFGVLFALAAGRLGELGGTLATIVAWAAIVTVNIAHARAR